MNKKELKKRYKNIPGWAYQFHHWLDNPWIRVPAPRFLRGRQRIHLDCLRCAVEEQCGLQTEAGSYIEKDTHVVTAEPTEISSGFDTEVVYVAKCDCGSIYWIDFIEA